MTPPWTSTWYVVDLIDGTGNFVRGIPLARISVGAALDGEFVAGCVYDLFREESFTGAAGSPRRHGGTSVPLGTPRPNPPTDDRRQDQRLPSRMGRNGRSR
ncbi:inositol monophosphatase [Streptomyces sp. IMTB 2501]|uniref:inositol monophosphatase family protein n=1 Tax=Streptomyces sp. IMTB 2501 TaxID=1776340 RepID=UPI0035324859